jgi:hypothetical protein
MANFFLNKLNLCLPFICRFYAVIPFSMRLSSQCLGCSARYFTVLLALISIIWWMYGLGKILITCDSGFIGRQLATTLADSGMSVLVLIRNSSAREFLQHPNILIWMLTGFSFSRFAKMEMKDKRPAVRMPVTMIFLN